MGLGILHIFSFRVEGLCVRQRITSTAFAVAAQRPYLLQKQKTKYYYCFLLFKLGR